MALSVGDKLPDATFHIMTADGPGTTTTSEVFGGKKIAAFALPGAFTGTCTNQHVPGFLSHADEFRAKGCDGIVCITVNDPFVVAAWSKQTGADGKIDILGDAAAEFTNAVDMAFDGAPVGLIGRSKRYAMIVEDGVVKALNVEETPGTAEASSAENLLKAL